MGGGGARGVEFTFSEGATAIERGYAQGKLTEEDAEATEIPAVASILAGCDEVCTGPIAQSWCSMNGYPENLKQLMDCNSAEIDTMTADGKPAYQFEMNFTGIETQLSFP